MDAKYKKAYEIIKQAKNVLLVTHNRPDGDALSSMCAMIELINSLEKNFTAFCFDKPPQQFDFLPKIEIITSKQEKINFKNRDLIISLDCGEVDRTKIKNEIVKRRENQIYIEFDHHPGLDDDADLEIRQSELSSTGEVLYNFFKSNNIKITKNIANCLLTGIMTDTGNLIYPSTSKETVKIASELLRLGARFPLIHENTWRNKSLKAMKVWGRAMDRLVINKKYKIAISVLDHKDISESGATDEELEGISGFLSSISGANALLFLREEAPGSIRGSLRGIHPKSDISILAQKLGGGGHAKASGFALSGTIKKKGGSWRVR